MLVLGLSLACSSCAAGRSGPSDEAAGKALAHEILERNSQVADATLAGRFVLESEKGAAKGSLRIRYVSPDIYRVDVIAAGVAGASGGSSFFVEGDSSLVYVSPGRRAESAVLEEVGVVTFLEDFDLALADLKALVISGAYLDIMRMAGVSCRGARGGYVLDGREPNGDIITTWISKDKQSVTKSIRGASDGLPIVETKLSKFKRVDGVWRPMRRVVRHFGQEASLSVQYDRILVNRGLDPKDLYIRGAAS